LLTLLTPLLSINATEYTTAFFAFFGGAEASHPYFHLGIPLQTANFG
jgi:hypothetical protein